MTRQIDSVTTAKSNTERMNTERMNTENRAGR